jgi:hypothetical protein
VPKFGEPEEEFEEELEPRKVFYGPGDLGKMALPVLKEIIAHRAPEGNRERLERFLDFVSPKDLEEYLLHVLDYGASRVLPKKTARRVAGGG